MDRKKRILFVTDYCGVHTGFGKVAKLLLTYLFKTGKYEICNAACGLNHDNPEYERFPWKTIGVIPNDPGFIERMRQDPNFARIASYGEPQIVHIVKEFKPDVIFAIQDSWGALHIVDKPFFKKIPTVCWITFDSLPLLPDTIEKASKIQHYWAWNQFSVKEFHRIGHTHVRTQYPLLNTKNFYPLLRSEKDDIRKKHKIPQDAFIVGFVFRNQLRKLINSLIEGYSVYVKQHPEKEKSTYILAHTNLSEGWNLERLCEQYNVNKNRILCTYICKETGEYFILPMQGQDIENPKTKRKSLITPNIQFGVTDTQLNEIYNIIDLYTQYCTSGATETPAIEAALTEKIISTCNYSFGEDIIQNNKGSIPVDFNFYTEHQTQFLKSQPSPHSIAKVFHKVVTMKPDKRSFMEKSSRQWALENYSIEVNGPKIEKFIDEQNIITDEDSWSVHDTQKFNPNAQIPEISDNKEYIITLYRDILDMKVDENYDGVQSWLKQLENSVPRQSIKAFFIKVANDEIAKRQETNWDDIFGPRGKKKKLLFIIPRSIGDIILATSLFKSLRTLYPSKSWEFHVSTEGQYRDIIDGNPYVDRWIPYHPSMDNTLWLEGKGSHVGWYDIAILSNVLTQKTASYVHNGIDKMGLNLKLKNKELNAYS